MQVFSSTFVKFNNRKDIDLGDLSLWRYSNDVISGKTLLYNYMGSDWGGNPHPYLYAYDCTFGTSGTFYVDSFPTSSGSTIYYSNYSSAASLVGNVSSVYNQNYFSSTMRTVGEAYEFNRNITADIPSSDGGALYIPKAKGKAIINDWISPAASGALETNRNTPFYNNKNIVNVDLQNVPFRNNSMYHAFINCYNLKQVNRLPESITDMVWTFGNCYNLNYNIKIPSSVTNMHHTFYYCLNLNQNIQIPNTVTNMHSTFTACSKLNQNIKIPSLVTDMWQTFSHCYNLNQNIQIPNSVTNMGYTFYDCNNLTNVTILSTELTNSVNTFSGVSSPNVYIYFKYANGAYTDTYNRLQNFSVILRNLGTAPSSSGNTGGNIGCILPDTKILMADGSTKEVQDIKLLDKVVGYNQQTNTFESVLVLDKMPSKKADVIKITLDDESYIELTTGHALLSERGWVAYKPENSVVRDDDITIDNLYVGDKILTKDGTYKIIESIEEENLGEVEVYDLLIEKTHTYVANDLIVHNAISVGA